jgi:hypothetical protein
MFVVKLTNGRGFTEWFSTLAVRMQADRKVDARQFKTQEEAQEMADFCARNADAFSCAYWDAGRPSLTAKVEPA